ncbi:ParA family protein [Enterococcus diestrammenae]|uniref:Chromosome partitioning protein n=1 Tax=Enterococcus diestrammenae TaxID=1155073 RepID=A0ABV0F5S9_9ENTE|nr:ParA family protein [Enterococcus diestrammenae]KAF1298785.1 hypothetical protein BAU18_05945 [Enterococcus diestrammenae]HIX69741.1 ParA family protein [Candidatus Enterococcus stercoravium]
MTKSFTVNIQKGGVGKTTLTINGAYYLIEKEDANVLLIDMDESINLSKRFKELVSEGEDIPEESTVREFFTNTGNPKPIKISDQMDLIYGYDKLAELEKEVEAGKGRGYLLAWYFKNLKELESKYDYILIDTHNSFNIFTDNAIAMSDYVLAIADIDEDAIEKLRVEDRHVEELKEAFINPITSESFVRAKVLKVGNKVQNNTHDSQMFKKAFEQMMKMDSAFLGYFEFRSLFGKVKTTGQPLTELELVYNTPSYRRFFDSTWNLYKKIFSGGELDE